MGLEFHKAAIVPVQFDADFGVLSEITQNGIPQFIEIGLKDGNVLKIYADGTHSDMADWRFVAYQAPSNFPARKWLFEQFFKEHYPKLWQVYKAIRWFDRRQRRLWIWWLNKTEKRPGVTHF